MANNEKAKSEAEFRHNTSIGPNGNLLFDCPIEIRNQQDLDNYHITWNDCRTLNFHGSDKVTVYFFKTDNRALAEYQWSYLDTQHSRGYASQMHYSRQEESIHQMPRHRILRHLPLQGQEAGPLISWDGLVETGYEPVSRAPVGEQAIAKDEYNSIKALMDAEDARIARAFKMKELQGYSVREIAAEL